jgi:hypothetical protein
MEAIADALMSSMTTTVAMIEVMAIDVEKSNTPLVTTYRGPLDETSSKDYRVKVNGNPVFVYQARVSAIPFNQWWPGYQRPKDQTELASFAYWDMSGPVNVEVWSERPVETVAIRPTSYGIRPLVDGNRIKFRMLRPQQITVEVNGTHYALHLFGNPPEENAPKPTDPNVLYFGPGIHWPGKIEMKSNQTVYIAGGAVVYGYIEATEQSNLRVLGRGILDVSEFKRPTKVWNNPSAKPLKPSERSKLYLAADGGIFGGVISMCGCQNVLIEGIVVRDSNLWTIVPAGCRQVRIANVKLIGLWRYNTDGINTVNSEDVTIDGCFIRSFDDSICIKGGNYWHAYKSGDRPVRNVTVSNCVIWNDWARALVFSGVAVAPEMANIVFRDCDIIRATGTVMGLHLPQKGAHIHDVRFENIRVEIDDEAYTPMIQKTYDAKYTGKKGVHCPSLLSVSIKGKGGPIQRVYLKNISVTGSGRHFPRSSLKGYDDEHCVEDVTIENLRVYGKLVQNEQEGKIRIGEYVNNVKFVTSHDEQKR